MNRCLFILYISITSVGWLQAQDPYYININKSKGLPSNEVFDVFQDSKGFMWFATDEGVCRYDGKIFKTYMGSLQTSRASTCISEDKYGRIWFTNFDNRVYFIDNEKVCAIAQNPPPGLFLKYFISSNYIFIPQIKGVDVFDLKTLALKKTFLLNNLFYTYGCGDLFYVQASLPPVLYTIDRDLRLKKNSSADSIAGKMSVISCKDNTAYICNKNNSQDGIYLFHPQRKLKKYNFPYKEFITNVSITGDDIWICTKNGVYTKNIHASESGYSHYFTNKFISWVFKDRDNNYWISTTNEGVMFIPSLRNKYVPLDGFRPYKMQVVRHEIWVSGKKNTIIAFNPVDFSMREVFRGKTNHEVICLAYDSCSRTTLFCSDLFYGLKENRMNQCTGMPVKDVCFIDDKYCSYAASGANGLYIYNPAGKSALWDSLFLKKINKKTEYRKFSDFIETSRGKSTTYDKINNKIYYATNNGLYTVSPTWIQEIKYKGNTIHARQVSFYDGHVLVLQNNGILLRVNEKNDIQEYPFVYNGELLLVNKIILRNDLLFIITNNGFLFTVDLKSKKIIPHQNEEINKGMEINDIVVWQDKYIISLADGLLVLERNNINKKKINPQLIFNGISVDGIPINANAEINLPYYKNNITVTYSILSYNTNFTYPLYYRINGGKWTLTSAETRQLELASLQPNQYQIDFRLGNQLPLQSVFFVINKPIWMVHWFWLAIVAVVFIIAYLLYRWQVGLLRKRNNLLVEKMELEKNLNKSILTSIKAQMNPHFFYNALNTIQAFIFANDKKNASTYLHKFSRLTRLILEMSEKETITLSEEIQALQLYLDIEKARFNDKLNYTIYICPSIEAELTHIPPMMIQPYVENAIKHGLLHKKEDRQLHIRFEKKISALVITIEDNGIGRIKSAELNTIKENKHQSFAMAANQKRLEILNAEEKKLALTFVDKYDEAGNARGTTVIISLPLNT